MVLCFSALAGVKSCTDETDREAAIEHTNEFS